MVVSISCARTHERPPAVYGFSVLIIVRYVWWHRSACVFALLSFTSSKRDTQHSAGVKSSMEHVELVAFDLSQH